MGFKAYRFIGVKTQVVGVVITGRSGSPSSLVSR
jgi:hypothetical protein